MQDPGCGLLRRPLLRGWMNCGLSQAPTAWIDPHWLLHSRLRLSGAASALVGKVFREGDLVTFGVAHRSGLHETRRPLDLSDGYSLRLQRGELLLKAAHHEGNVGRSRTLCIVAYLDPPPSARCHSANPSIGSASAGRPRSRSYQVSAEAKSSTATSARTLSIAMSLGPPLVPLPSLTILPWRGELRDTPAC